MEQQSLSQMLEIGFSLIFQIIPPGLCVLPIATFIIVSIFKRVMMDGDSYSARPTGVIDHSVFISSKIITDESKPKPKSEPKDQKLKPRGCRRCGGTTFHNPCDYCGGAL
jgi:hypothetical protein